MAEMKTLNGYEIVDAKAREDIAKLQENSGADNIDLSEYATKKELEAKQDKLNTYADGDGELFGPTIYGISGTSYSFNRNKLYITTASSQDTNFKIYAGSGIANGELDFSLSDGDIKYTHNVVDTGNTTTKTVAFIEDMPKILPITQSEYDALLTKDETTIYIIKE